MKVPSYLLASATAALLVLAPLASAHVTLRPEETPGGGFTRLDVRIPTERDDASTTKAEVQFPPGFLSVSTEPVTGWDAKIVKRKLDKPVSALTFKAVQTYSGGEVVRGIGSPDSEEPAPQVKLAAAQPEGGPSEPAAEEQPTVPAESGADDDSGNTLAIIALVVAIAALAAGPRGPLRRPTARRGA